MFTRHLFFYTVAGSAIAYVVEALGADIGVIIFAALVIPPAMLIALALYRRR